MQEQVRIAFEDTSKLQQQVIQIAKVSNTNVSSILPHIVKILHGESPAINQLCIDLQVCHHIQYGQL